MTVNSGKLKIPLLEVFKWLLILALAGFIFLQLHTNRESNAGSVTRRMV